MSVESAAALNRGGQPPTLLSKVGIKWSRNRAGQGLQASDLRVCSPDWTRTSNLPINSRLLCQLSYRGMLRIEL